MARAFVRREQAPKYQVQKGDTLANIIASKCEPEVAWREFALYNWGTAESAEVNRILLEVVGCGEPNADPSLTPLDPSRGAKSEILIPKVWKQAGLAINKVHTLKVRKRLPPPAVSITRLDKWFVPEEDTCDIDYELQGIKERADKVDFEVWGSHYAKPTPEADGDFVKCSWSEVDVPIQRKRLAGKAEPRRSYALRDWRGESEAGDGHLKPKAPKKRFINVAFSPYTVHLRYYKNDADNKARIRLEPFWPQFSPPRSGAVTASSLRVKWKVESCGKLKHGQIVFWNGQDEMVYRKALKPSDLSEGEHDFNWSDGQTIVKPEGMPYRVQIQAHSDMDEDDGVAIAAMHTEVRMFVHPETGTHEKAADDPNSLEISIAPFVPDTAPPAKGSVRWYKLRLAELGYHPGPINDDDAHAAFTLALREFQRSYTENDAAPFKRLRADVARNAATETALARAAANARPPFGNPASRADYEALTVDLAIQSPAESMIVWADDRHYYTHADAADVQAASMADFAAMEDYRGDMDSGDQKPALDEKSIPRPWIPVQAAIPLLRKGSSLQDSFQPAVTDAMRRAIGPLRVDWTFEEIGEDLDAINPASYSKTRTRTRKFVELAVDGKKAAHGGKTLRNCAAEYGGIRPASASDYYHAPFGRGADSLAPWKALAHNGNETVYSLVHDDVGQAADKLFDNMVGRAGVYLRPSIIAGDGYQFAARVSFWQLVEGAYMPNREALSARYPVPPRAQTAKLRVWRKSALRAYVRWAPPASQHWGMNGSWEAAFQKFYEPAFVTFAGADDAPKLAISNLLDASKPADLDLYKDIITRYSSRPEYKQKDDVKLNSQYIWPWLGAKHFGVKNVPASSDFSTYEDVFMEQEWNFNWRKFREPLLVTLVKRLEAQTGRLRGHIVVEFESSPQYWKQIYRCKGCAREQILIEAAAAGDTGVNEDCHLGCGGKLDAVYTEDYKCSVCNGTTQRNEPAAAGGTHANDPCPLNCSGTFTVVNQARVGANVRVAYRCSVCNTNYNTTEKPANAPFWAGKHGCSRPCAGRLQHQNNGPWPKSIVAGPNSGLTMPAVGVCLGATYIFSTGGNPEVWAHEIGHHKHIEHAASAPGAQAAQHDTAANAEPSIAGFAAADRQWDRDCIMSYTSLDAADPLYFCGKCILKHRGWKVEGIANPGSAVVDDP
jgi:hypothetical protein